MLHAILHYSLLVIDNLLDADFFLESVSHGGCGSSLAATHQVVQLLLLTMKALLERLRRTLIVNHGRLLHRTRTIGPVLITSPCALLVGVLHRLLLLVESIRQQTSLVWRALTIRV